jgi:hypothetical protein
VNRLWTGAGRLLKSVFFQSLLRELGGPGRARTSNQTVMSRRL